MTRRERRGRFVEAVRARTAPERVGTRTAIHVRIHDLVLHQFPAHGARRIGDSVASELTHLLALHGVPEPMLALHGTERVDAGIIGASAAPDRAEVGRDIARALYGCQAAPADTPGRPKGQA